MIDFWKTIYILHGREFHLSYSQFVELFHTPWSVTNMIKNGYVTYSRGLKSYVFTDRFIESLGAHDEFLETLIED